MFKLLGVFLCLSIGTYAVPADHKDDFKLPPGVITCQMDSPTRDECMKEAIQDMLPKLADGNEHLNIPPLDPLHIEEVGVQYKYSPTLFGSGSLKNVLVSGSSHAKVLTVKTNLTKTHFMVEIKFTVPRLLVEGSYKADGRFNQLKVKSKGFFNMTATNITSTYRSVGQFEVVDGKRYIRVIDLEIDPNIRSMVLHASGIFADPQLNQIMVDLINQYWPAVYKDVIRDTRQYWAPVVLKLINKFLLYVPVDVLLYTSGDAA